MKKLVLLLFTVTLIMSCECEQKAQGVVIDNETKLPLNKVLLSDEPQPRNSKGSDPIFQTKADGMYNYSVLSEALSGCPDITLYFFKSGYITVKQTFTSDSGGDTVYMVKIR
jgi:hypothetical protein